MNKHYGQIVEYVVRTSGFSINDLAAKIKTNRRSVYNWFQTKNLRGDIIYRIGCIIKHDFIREFPELYLNPVDSLYAPEEITENGETGKLTKIFVIDDEEMDTVIFKMVAKKVVRNMQIHVFNDGEAAINELLALSLTEPESLPDYIFLDLNMPVMNGWEFLSEFDRLNIDPLQKIHIHILSSSIFTEDIDRSLSNPLVDDFISKPIKLDKIKDIFEVS